MTRKSNQIIEFIPEIIVGSSYLDACCLLIGW